MKQTVQSDVGQAPKTAEPTRSRPAQRQAFASGGHLTQLAGMVNGSPRVQALAQMKEDIQRSARVQSLQRLAAAQLSESVRSPIAPGEAIQLKIGIAGTLAHSDRVAGKDNAMEEHGSSAAESSSSPCGCSSKPETGAGANRQTRSKQEKPPAQKKSKGEDRSASAQRKEDSTLAPNPAMQLKAEVPVNDDVALEHEAHVMGAKALQARLLCPRLGNEYAPPTQLPVQRTIDDDLQNLEDDYQSTDDPLLKRLLAEARTLSDVEFRSENDPEQGHAARTVIGDRREHEVVLDPRITDPLTRQSLLLHELIHVSSDRKYNANSIGEPDPGLTAWVDPAATKAEQLREIGRQNRYRYSLAEHLDKVVDGDWAIDEQIARFVKDRLMRVMGASHREFDSVLTERAQKEKR